MMSFTCCLIKKKAEHLKLLLIGRLFFFLLLSFRSFIECWFHGSGLLGWLVNDKVANALTDFTGGGAS